jgi:hypothetical protein
MPHWPGYSLVWILTGFVCGFIMRQANVQVWKKSRGLKPNSFTGGELLAVICASAFLGPLLLIPLPFVIVIWIYYAIMPTKLWRDPNDKSRA